MRLPYLSAADMNVMINLTAGVSGCHQLSLAVCAVTELCQQLA